MIRIWTPRRKAGKMTRLLAPNLIVLQPPLPNRPFVYEELHRNCRKILFRFFSHSYHIFHHV